MAKPKNIVVVTWEYEKDWVKKKNYATIWKLFAKDGKLSMKLELIPVWWNWWANIYDNDSTTRKNVEVLDWDIDVDDLPF